MINNGIYEVMQFYLLLRIFILYAELHKNIEDWIDSQFCALLYYRRNGKYSTNYSYIST